jgi:hypothetical protein
MIDVKKLVTGFLVLATAVSASAFVVANFGGSFRLSTTTANVGSVTSAGNLSQATALAGNAFLPQTPNAQANNSGASNIQNLPSSTAAIAANPSNLTNILANTYLNNLVAANPNGPAADASGNENLLPPANNTVINQFAASSTAASIQIPDWDAEAAEIPIVTLNSSSDTIASYNNAVQDIISKDLVQTNLESMLSNNSDQSAANFAQQKIQTALKDIAGIKTPSSVLAFQKSLITLLIYEKNTLALAANAPTDPDPVKTSIILQGEESKYSAAVQNFSNELQVDPGIQGLSFGGSADHQTNSVVAFIDQLAGVQTAHAQWITFDPTAFAQTILEYTNNIILQILKNVIVSLIQTKVLAWIRGNGAPRFIQNWATTLVNSYQQAALSALNSQFACINPALTPQVKLLIQVPQPVNAGGGNVCAVQFPAVLSATNLSKFYNNFSSGGFASYLALFQPGGNVFSASMDAQDAAMNAGATNQQATQAKSIANQGFTSDEICDDGSDPINGQHETCPSGLAPNDQGQCLDDTGQAASDLAVLVPNDGLCADGTQPEASSPGAATGQVFNSAINSGSNLVTSANDIAGLLNAALSSLLNSLATQAITLTTGAFNGVINNGPTDIGGATVTTSGNGNNTQVTATTPITCSTAQNIAGSNGLNTSLSPNSFTFTATGGQTLTQNGSLTNPQFTWSAPGGNPSFGNGSSFSVTYGAVGTFTATVTDTNTGNSQTCTAMVTSIGS